MYIAKNDNYIVPTIQINFFDNNFFDKSLREEINNEKVSKLRENIKHNMQYLFLKIKDLMEFTEVNERYYAAESIFKAVMIAHVNNGEWFQNIKKAPVNGVTKEELMKENLSEFNKLYDFHNNLSNCNREVESKQKCFSKGELEVKIMGLSTNIDLIINQMSKRAGNLPSGEILKLHLLIMETFINLLMATIPYFEQAKNGYDAISLEKLKGMHKQRFTNIFNRNLQVLGCE
ncbi:Uncharacterised protein [uncultured Clostridium sp.]|uniref:hypothetical protein n=1 Tax=uncultured Clostridium sp. TaxID=59620 RepID=UPI00082148AB|nr:hypothetical protein [uncultured Clostridium sp.]SCJ50991.1 Uncharacterised protein [uncultured Clostridium sp.]